MVTKICIGDYVGDTNRHEKVYADRIRGFVFANFFVVFLVLPVAYSQDARIDFDAKCAKRHGCAKGYVLGSQNQYLKF